MVFIGKVVKQYCTKLRMLSKGLALNISSEKYVYLFETGKQTPSSHFD